MRSRRQRKNASRPMMASANSPPMAMPAMAPVESPPPPLPLPPGSPVSAGPVGAMSGKVLAGGTGGRVMEDLPLVVVVLSAAEGGSASVGVDIWGPPNVDRPPVTSQ